MSGRHRRVDGESGVVAGGEALLLGTLVFVTGALLLVAMWTIVDAKLAVESSARSAARAVVEAPAVIVGSAGSDDRARSIARSAAVASMTAQRGTSAGSWTLVDVDLRGRFERCGAIEARVLVRVDTPRLPFIGRRLTAGELTGTHVERIEPYRAGLPLPPAGISC